MASAWEAVLILLLAAVGAWLVGSVVRALATSLGYAPIYAGDLGGLAALGVFLVTVVGLSYRRFSPW
jgi:hypothetical protein